MKGNIYFVSDFHFGVPGPEGSRVREKKFVAWLDSIRPTAAEIYLMGDLFDFWFEYKTAIPKGYSRVFGKLAELTDSGIPIHLFKGNHDMWAFDYLTKELNIMLYRKPEFRTILGKTFYLAHGDGLGPGDHGYKLIKKIFANKINQWLFRQLHPDAGIRLANYWSQKSRYANLEKEKQDLERNLNFILDRLSVHSETILRTNPGLDFLVYGHYHYPHTSMIGSHAVQVVLGDWISHFTYAVFNGEQLEIKVFE